VRGVGHLDAATPMQLPFNSLFEIQRTTIANNAIEAMHPFNSLFEILFHGGGMSRKSLEDFQFSF